MRRLRLITILLVGALPVAALAACASTAPSPIRLVQSDSPNTSGMEGLLRGSLVIDQHGCVQAKTQTNVLVTPVWPLGYSVRGDATSFEILDHEGRIVARSGAILSIGGGGADRFENGWTEHACVAGGSLWMVGMVASA